jgi:type VI secretion system protein ImpG
VAQGGNGCVQSKLKPKPLSPVGFSQSDLLLPSKKYPFEPFQVFSEYCSYASKFRFADLDDFYDLAMQAQGDSFDIYVFMDRYQEKYVRLFQADLFQTGCTPVVNLFSAKSKPIHFDHTSTEYVVEAGDHLIKSSVEIYDVDHLSGWRNDGSQVECQRLHCETYASHSRRNKYFWEIVRREMWEFGEFDLSGQEVFLRINTAHASKDHPWHASADITCTNRDIPARTNLCQQGGEFELLKGDQNGFTINCLQHPTPCFRKVVDKDQLFILLSMMVASHDQYFIPDGQCYDAKILRQHLRSLNSCDNQEVDLFIDQIKGIVCRRITRRYPKDTHLTFVNGLEVIVEVEVPQEDQEEIYLFSSVLRHVFRFYCPINSVMEFSIFNRISGESYQWPAQFH